MSLVLAVLISIIIFGIKATDQGYTQRSTIAVEEMQKRIAAWTENANKLIDREFEERGINLDDVLYKKLKVEVNNELNLEVRHEMGMWLYLLAHRVMPYSLVYNGVPTRESGSNSYVTRGMMARQLRFMKWYESKLHEFGINVTIMYVKGRNVYGDYNIEGTKIREIEELTAPGWYYVDDAHPYLGIGGGTYRYIGFDRDYK